MSALRFEEETMVFFSFVLVPFFSLIILFFCSSLLGDGIYARLLAFSLDGGIGIEKEGHVRRYPTHPPIPSNFEYLFLLMIFVSCISLVQNSNHILGRLD